MGLLKLPIYDGVPSASFFEPGSFAVVDETPEPEDGQPEPTERKLAIWVGDETGVPRQAGGGIDEKELFEILPIEASEGWGSLAVGPNSRQRGTAYGNGTVSFTRQGHLYGDYSVGIGRRVRSSSGAAFSLVVGDDAWSYLKFQFAHGVSPGNNLLTHQRSWLQHYGIVRGGAPDVAHDSGSGPRFSAQEGQKYNVTASVSVATAGGAETGEYRLHFVARWPHGGALEVIPGQVETVRTDNPNWNAYPVSDGQAVDIMWEGGEDKQYLLDVHYDWHETTLPGKLPVLPTAAEEQVSGQIAFRVDTPPEVDLFQGYADRVAIFRGQTPDTLTYFNAFDVDYETVSQVWQDEGNNQGRPAPESGQDYYYQIAHMNQIGFWGPRTEVLGPYSI